MAGIRVNTSIKKIEVNDNGDYITLNFSDQNFPQRFFAMMDLLQAKADEAKKRAEEIESAYPADSLERIRAGLSLEKEVYGVMVKEIDNLFGPDTCRKVFGDITPGIEMFEDFFNQLTPYFREYSQERAAKLGKYSPARTGNV